MTGTPLKLADIALLFEYIDQDARKRARNASQLRSILRKWIEVTRERKLAFHSWIRLLVPQVPNDLVFIFFICCRWINSARIICVSKAWLNI